MKKPLEEKTSDRAQVSNLLKMHLPVTRLANEDFSLSFG